MKRKLFLSILIVFFTVSFMSFPSICFSEPDSKVWESFQPRFYYNKTNLIKSSNIISVWVYEITTDEQRKEMIEIVKKESLEKSKKYQHYEYKMMLWKIDCKNRQGKREKTIYYDDKGKVLDQFTYKNSEWESIPPESNLEILYNRICITQKKPYVEPPRVKNRDNNDWVNYGETNNDNVYLYKKVNIKKNVVQLWRKTVFSEKGREEIIQYLTKMGVSTEGYDKLSYVIGLMEIDCKKRKIRTLHINFYDSNVHVLHSSDYDPLVWGYIIPDSGDEHLLKKVCK